MLFIHRSVGRNLLEEGNLRQLLNSWHIQLDDYDNNTGILTYDDGTAARGLIIPGNNTNPESLAAFFADWPELLNGYDAVMFKSCYPNSHIQDAHALETAQTYYTSILGAFRTRQKTLIILTTPPLRPLFTNTREAALANQLAAWLVGSSDDLVHVFDFHHALSEPAGRHTGMLKRAYRRPAPWDNHPNSLAHQTLAPHIATFIGSLSK